MEQNNREEIEIDLKQIFFVLLDKIFIILASGLFIGVLAFAYTKIAIDPIYESETTTFVIQSESDNEAVDANDFVMGNYLSKNFVEVVKSNTVFEEVITSLELDMTADELRGKVAVENVAETQIIKITVSDTDPYRAQKIANAVRNASEKAIVKITKVSGVETVDAATLPKEPSSPSAVKNTLIGVILGMFIAVAVVVVRFILDDSIKSPEDIEKYLGMSTLASIPMMEESEYDGDTKKTSVNNKNKRNVRNMPKRETVR